MQARYLELIGQKGEPATTAPQRGHFQPPDARHSSSETAGDGHRSVAALEGVIEHFQGEPEPAAMMKSWGADASDNSGFAASEAVAILNSVSAEAAAAMEQAVDGMEPADYANLMRHLADAGRARGTR